MTLDIMLAQPTFRHERNLILLLCDLNIYAINKKDWIVESGMEENKIAATVFKARILRTFRENIRSIIHYTNHCVKSIIIDKDSCTPGNGCSWLPLLIILKTS